MGFPRLSAFLSTVSLAGLLALSGCVASPPAHFYQLQQGNPALPEDNHGVAVLLGPLQVADYLKRESVVQRQLDGNLSVSREARWAGSLEDDIARLLLRQLAARLDSSRLALYPDRIGFKPEVQVLLNIDRLDSGPQQAAVLEAQWRLLDAQGQMRGSRVVRLERPHTGSMVNQLRVQSELLQELAGLIADAVKAMPASAAAPAATPARQRPQPRRSAPPSAEPRIPVVSPAAGAGEVYRF